MLCWSLLNINDTLRDMGLSTVAEDLVGLRDLAEVLVGGIEILVAGLRVPLQGMLLEATQSEIHKRWRCEGGLRLHDFDSSGLPVDVENLVVVDAHCASGDPVWLSYSFIIEVITESIQLVNVNGGHSYL